MVGVSVMALVMLHMANVLSVILFMRSIMVYIWYPSMASPATIMANMMT